MNTPLSAIARARRLPVTVPSRPAPTSAVNSHPGADLVAPGYSQEQVRSDRSTVLIARHLWTTGNYCTSTSIAYYAECISISERLMAERDRLMRLLVSERIGRPEATVISVLEMVTTRMADFASEAPEVFEDLDPIQALTMVVGGMLGELAAPAIDDAVLTADILDTTTTTLGDEYGMYSAEGDKAVASQVRTLVDRMTSGQLTREALPGELAALMRTCEVDGFPEVIDTDVREVIAEKVNQTCAALGWAPIDSL